MNPYRLNPDFEGHEQYGLNHMVQQDPFPYSYCNNDLGDISALQTLDQYHHIPSFTAPLDNGDPIEIPDIPDTCFNYISNLLREDYSDDRPGATLQDYMAAQATYNQSLDAALVGEPYSFLSANYHHLSPNSVCEYPSLNGVEDYSCLGENLNLVPNTSSSVNPYANLAPAGNNISTVQNGLVGSNFASGYESSNTLIENLPLGDSTLVGLGETQQYEQVFGLMSNASEFGNIANVQGDINYHPWDLNMTNNAQLQPTLLQAPTANVGGLLSNCTYRPAQGANGMVNFQDTINRNPENVQNIVQCNGPTSKVRGRENDEGGEQEDNERSTKQSARSSEVTEQVEKYGEILHCPEGRSKSGTLGGNAQNSDQTTSQNVGSTSNGSSKKRGNKAAQVIDLRGLLTRCAQSVARVDLTGAYDLLKIIRQHSSPCGDYLQRVAHYLANGLEARLEGRGSEVSRANQLIPPEEVLKANRVYVASVPYKIMSYYTTNKTIAKLLEDRQATSVHIIDFGIFYGLQWPCIIRNLALCPNGPPRLRITGIDFPQPGFRPAERVEETGRCLASFCEKYNVPFEYHPIAKNWEDIQLEELNIDRNEALVVNCLYRSHNLYDESVDESSPRDAFLRLVRKINPHIFMHGVVNSTSSVPFFLNRFKEAMFHYTAFFDLFEKTMTREDSERMILESKLYGNQALNVIACEGAERVERPESYKQWQVRTQRAGFEQVPLDRQLVRRARSMVRRNFREEFSYDEDGYWVIQGWKGRILYAISCWKPSEDV